MTGEHPGGPHERFESELAELAVGVLGGRERAVLLDHVGSCATCTAELEELTTAADSLVRLAPAVDPPVGFESRVFERLAASTGRAARVASTGRAARTGRAASTESAVATAATGTRRGTRRRWLTTVVAAGLVAGAFGVGWVLHPSNGPPARSAAGSEGSTDAADAPLLAGTRSLGLVSVYPGSPGWLLMTVSSSAWTGSVRCIVTTADGASFVVGSFALAPGGGSWGAPLPVPAGQVRSAEVVATDGHVLAGARLR